MNVIDLPNCDTSASEFPRRSSFGMRLGLVITAGTLLGCTSIVRAQPVNVSWWTVAGSGGTSTGGGFTVTGTIGQPDAGTTLTGGGFSCHAGYWGDGAGAPCYANCDNSTAPPILNANDFQCFLNLFAASDSRANCDNSTAPPVLNANDFQCFLNKYAQGCL